MSAIAIVVIGVIVIVALFILGGAIWFAWDSDKRVRTFAHSTDLIPGKPGRAPDEWTTATSPEALLHRRIRYAIADVHQVPTIPNSPAAMAARDRLDQAVFSLDDQLIAAAELTGDERTERVAQLEQAVVALEAAPTKLWDASNEQQTQDLDELTAELERA